MLHVLNGDCAAAAVAPVRPAGERRLVWRDILMEGPLGEDLRTEAFTAFRGAYLARHFGIDHDRYVEEVRQMEAGVEDGARHEEVVLWFEEDLFCYVNLLYLLASLPRRLPASTRLTLICPGGFPGVERFRGLTSLTSAQLGTLFAQRQPVTEPTTALAAEAWRAFCAPDPTALERIGRRGAAGLPFLPAAVLSQLRRFPATRTGLDDLESRALEALRDGPRAFPALFAAVSAHERIGPLGAGDVQFAGSMRALAEGALPLVMIRGLDSSPPLDPDTVRHWTIELAPEGRDVLDGRRDRVSALGIDRWLGGTHLDSRRGDLWRWDEDARRLVAAGSAPASAATNVPE